MGANVSQDGHGVTESSLGFSGKDSQPAAKQTQGKSNRKAQPPQVETRYEGVVKWFRGSFGWVDCAAVSQKYEGYDVFLHRVDCDGSRAPKLGDRVSFRLTLDDNGNPKAIEAKMTERPMPAPEPAAIPAREWFARQR